MTQPLVPDRAADGVKIPVKLKLVARATFVAQRTSFAFDLIKHVPAVFTVLTAGLSALQGEEAGGDRALAAAELVVGAWVLIVIGREAWHLFGRGTADAFKHPDAHATPHESPKVDAANLAAAALGFVESWHRTHVSGHFKLISPQIVGGTLSLLLAFGGQRAIQKRQYRREFYIAVTPDGLHYRTGPRTSWRAKWSDIVAVEQTANEIIVRLQNGKRRVLRADAFFDGETLLAETSVAINTYAPAQLTGAVGGVNSTARTS